jgi:hypothetical protein
MAAMPGLSNPRRAARPPSGARARAAWLLALALSLGTSQVRAQGAASAEPDPAATPPEPPTPKAPTAPSPAQPAVGGTATTVPASPPEQPTLAPEHPPVLTPEPPQPLPPLTLDQGTTPAPQAVPFYHKDWFWGAVGLVVLTTAVILISAATSNTDAPATTLGNMRAF